MKHDDHHYNNLSQIRENQSQPTKMVGAKNLSYLNLNTASKLAPLSSANKNGGN